MDTDTQEYLIRGSKNHPLQGAQHLRTISGDLERGRHVRTHTSISARSRAKRNDGFTFNKRAPPFPRGGREKSQFTSNPLRAKSLWETTGETQAANLKGPSREAPTAEPPSRAWNPEQKCKAGLPHWTKKQKTGNGYPRIPK